MKNFSENIKNEIKKWKRKASESLNFNWSQQETVMSLNQFSGKA